MTDTDSRDLISALGGCSVVASHLGITLSRVWNWNERGVPWRFRPAVAKMAKERRLKLPSDFLHAPSEAA